MSFLKICVYIGWEELQEMAFLQLLFYFIGKCVIEEI